MAMGAGVEKEVSAASVSTLSWIIGKYEPVVAGVCYCGASMSMVLVNKHVLNNFGYPCTNSILLLQNVVSVLFVVLDFLAMATAVLIVLEGISRRPYVTGVKLVKWARKAQMARRARAVHQVQCQT